MKVGSLFAGIGGFDLGLERAGFEIAWQVEIDPYCQRVLAKHWPNVQRYGDIRAIDWATVPRVDLLCGGFPCQDLSTAGKRIGLRAGTRSGLWFDYAKAIRILRPKYILVENVSGLLDNHALGRVLGDLAEIGYDAEWSMFSACSFGASHMRERVFIVAYPNSLGIQAGCQRFRGICTAQSQVWATNQYSSGGEANGESISMWEPEPAISRVANGIPDRVDRIRGLGNAIVPQIAEWLGRQIMKVERA